MQPPTVEDVLRAAERLRGRAHQTPVVRSRTLDRQLQAQVFFKCESFQRTGSFKFRGATNALLQLSPEQRRAGVLTHSSGNHAQALALAAREIGISCTIVMPRSAPAAKRQAVQSYGARVILCDDTLVAREAAADQLAAQTGATLIHPYEHPQVVAGQGTAMLELWEQAGPLDRVLVPVGGGGLASGTLLALQHLCGKTEPLWGVEPALADDARRSLQQGKRLPSSYPPTIADGLRTALGRVAFSLLAQYGVPIVTVREQAIAEATCWVWSRLKVVVEPSAAVPVAALLEGKVPVQGQRVGIILSGGNVDCTGWWSGLPASGEAP